MSLHRSPVEVAVETETADCRECGQRVFMIDETWFHRTDPPGRACDSDCGVAAPKHSTRRDAIVYIQLPEDAVRTVVARALINREQT
jgi:hypothetical protein